MRLDEDDPAAAALGACPRAIAEPDARGVARTPRLRRHQGRPWRPVASARRRQVAWASVPTEWTTPAVERADPDQVAAERRALEQWLDYHRDTLLTK